MSVYDQARQPQLAQECYIKHEHGETHLLQWGAPTAPPLLLVHGLGGQAANYLGLAEFLAKCYWVIAPDLPGRGLSTWAQDPAREYCFSHYEAVVLSLLKALNIDQLRWVGTSMGGALGIRMTAGALSGRVTHLVVNDIGPTLPPGVAHMIAEAAGELPVAASLRELADWLAQNYAAVAKVERSSAYWMQRARYFARRRDDGRYTLHYDPRVVSQLIHHENDYEQWDAFDAIDVPLMVVHGALSTVLTQDILTRMQAKKPTMSTLVMPDFGHAPFLEDAAELERIGHFLQSESATAEDNKSRA